MTTSKCDLLAAVDKTEDGLSPKPVAYSCETSRIKEPLFTFLESHGYHRQKGVLSGPVNR